MTTSGTAEERPSASTGRMSSPQGLYPVSVCVCGEADLKGTENEKAIFSLTQMNNDSLFLAEDVQQVVKNTFLTLKWKL